jgi:DNA-binding PadR family transcriptional regulator
MRSTRRVVPAEIAPDMGHWSYPPLLTLVSLASGPKHGHGMIEDILLYCGTCPGPGTSYGAIARLENQGWIEAPPADERRHPYRIAPEGLRTKLTALHRLAKAWL